jgi:pSer/pThr/pTyr-binding forkhead associated (FHA) protein
MSSTLTTIVVLAILLIACLVIWRRVRTLHKPISSQSMRDVGERVSSSPAAPRANLLETPSPDTAFDPDATQIFRRTNPTSAAVALNRAGATVDTATLVGLSGSQRGRSYKVVEAGITIGRSSSCDVVLDDHRVSSRHAWVGIVDGKAVLRDLESTNGTFLNTATQTPIRQVELCAGDTIFFGGHQGDQFRFVASGAAKQTP